MEERRPKVGIGVVVFKDGKILLGQRKNAHGAGEYAGPGGHLEFGESFEDCARREVMEEAGIEIQNIRVVALSNILFDHNGEMRHYVDMGIVADWKSGEPRVMEPDRCESWGWYDPEALPEPLWKAERIYLEAIRTDKFYFGTWKK